APRRSARQPALPPRPFPLDPHPDPPDHPAVAAVQVGMLVLGRVQQRALRVVHLDLQRNDRVPANLHQDRSLFTTSKTSAAWPRGLTPYSAWRMTPFLSMTKVERTRHSRHTPSSVCLSWITLYLRHTSPSVSESSPMVTPLRSRKSACVRQSSRDTPSTTQSCLPNCSS